MKAHVFVRKLALFGVRHGAKTRFVAEVNG